MDALCVIIATIGVSKRSPFVGPRPLQYRGVFHSNPLYGGMNSQQYSECHLECYSVQAESLEASDGKGGFCTCEATTIAP